MFRNMEKQPNTWISEVTSRQSVIYIDLIVLVNASR